MKFYYNGKKVRESKNHEYKYGLLYMGEVIKCSKTKTALMAEIERKKKIEYGSSGNVAWMKSQNYPQAEIEEEERKRDERITSLKIVELEAVE